MTGQNIVRLPLAKRIARATFLVAILAVAGGIATAAVITACIEELAESDEISRVARASRLDPGNASIQNRLGRMELWGGGDLEQAMQRYHRAVMLNPNNAEYWADLAQVCQSTGNSSCAETGLQRAIHLAPMRPMFRWKLANYYVLMGDRERAFSAFAQLLSIAPEWAESTLDICLRAYGDPDSIWHAVVLPTGNPSVQLTMLSLMAHSKTWNTGEYWAEARDKKYDFATVAPYLDTLIDNGTYDLALRVWGDLQRRGVVRTSDGNPVYNGYFKAEPLNAGFDWHLLPQRFVSTSIDDGPMGNGRSLRVEFTVPSNADLEAAYQLLPIAGGTRHILRAWVKSEGITSNSGPKLRLTDAGCSECLDVSSAATTGTTSWHPIQLSFATNPETRAVRLSLYRSRSREFPMDISGTFWVTAVTLDSNQ